MSNRRKGKEERKEVPVPSLEERVLALERLVREDMPIRFLTERLMQTEVNNGQMIQQIQVYNKFMADTPGVLDSFKEWQNRMNEESQALEEKRMAEMMDEMRKARREGKDGPPT